MSALCPFCSFPTDERAPIVCLPANHPGYRGPSVEEELAPAPDSITLPTGEAPPERPATAAEIRAELAEVRHLARAITHGGQPFCPGCEQHCGGTCAETGR